MVDWESLSQVLAVNVSMLQEQAVRILIETELSRLDHEEIELIQKYHLLSSADLEQALQSRIVPEHPSWEDLIRWEAIEDRRKALKELLRNMSVMNS